jgi:hypothetical protein
MATLTAHRPPEQRGTSRATLDDLVAGVWGALQVTHAAGCVVCGGELAPRFGSGPHPVGAACRSCGSELS